MQEYKSLATLAGVDRGRISWGRFLAFSAAICVYAFTSLLQLLVIFKYTPQAVKWLQAIGETIGIVSIMLLIFLYIRHLWGAAFLIALINGYFATVWSILLCENAIVWGSFVYSFVRTLLFVLLLSYFVRWIKPLFLAMVLGCFAPLVVTTHIISALASLHVFSSLQAYIMRHFTYFLAPGPEWRHILYNLGASLAFGMTFYSGVARSWTKSNREIRGGNRMKEPFSGPDATESCRVCAGIEGINQYYYYPLVHTESHKEPNIIVKESFYSRLSKAVPICSKCIRLNRLRRGITGIVITGIALVTLAAFFVVYDGVLFFLGAAGVIAGLVICSAGLFVSQAEIGDHLAGDVAVGNGETRGYLTRQGFRKAANKSARTNG